MVDFILFQGLGLHQVVPRRCHFTFSHFFGLALIGSHSYLLGSRFELHHHQDADLVPTLEEYDHFLSLPTPMIWVYRPPTQSRFRKQLAELLGLKTHIMDVLTRYGSGLGGSIPFDFLLCQFGEPECPIAYRGYFMDLEEHWTFCRC